MAVRIGGMARVAASDCNYPGIPSPFDPKGSKRDQDIGSYDLFSLRVRDDAASHVVLGKYFEPGRLDARSFDGLQL